MESSLTYAPANTSHMKTVAVVIVGLVTWIVVATIVNFPLRAWWPHYHEAETAFNFTLGMKLVRLALGALASVCSGFVAAWIANGRRPAAIALGILLLVLFIPNHYLLWEKFPVWYHLTFLISLFPLTLLGATLKLPRCKRASSHPAPEQRLVFLGSGPKISRNRISFVKAKPSRSRNFLSHRALTRRESCQRALVVLGMASFILYIVIVFARLH